MVRVGYRLDFMASTLCHYCMSAISLARLGRWCVVACAVVVDKQIRKYHGPLSDDASWPRTRTARGVYVSERK